MADERERTAWWQRCLPVIAALAAAAAATWAITEAPHEAGLYLIWPFVALVPVVTPRQRDFRPTCFVAGSVLIVFGVLGTLWGLWIFIPAGLAVVAGGTTGGRIAWLGGTLSALVAATALGYAVSEVVPLYRPPDAFIVRFDSRQYQRHEDMLDALSVSPPSFGRGAVSVSIGADDAGPEWGVFFRTDLSSRGQAILRDYLGTLPGVIDVRYCDSPYDCGR